MPVGVELEVGEERFAAEVADEDGPADLEAPADQGFVDLPRRLGPFGPSAAFPGRLEDRVAFRVEGPEDGQVRGDVVEDDLGHPGEKLLGHGLI